MEGQEIQAFYQLKKSLGIMYSRAFPGATDDIRSLSGPDLDRFQGHLMDTVQGRVSEKWFYTHIKPEVNTRLPRIDVLNLLSQYVGKKSWIEFRDGILAELPQEKRSTTISGGKNWRKQGMIVGSGIILILIVISVMAMGGRKKTVCFVDSVLGTQLRDSAIRVVQLLEGESPRLLKMNKEGCVLVKSNADIIRLAVHVPYYQVDTLVRSWKEMMDQETMLLQPDDVANMIRYFATAARNDRIKRSTQLGSMIAPTARIIRMHSDGISGVEMYNKQEFVRFLLIFGQDNIDVLETKYKEGLLNYLRFTVRNGGN